MGNISVCMNIKISSALNQFFEENVTPRFGSFPIEMTLLGVTFPPQIAYHYPAISENFLAMEGYLIARGRVAFSFKKIALHCIAIFRNYPPSKVGYFLHKMLKI